MTLPDPEKWPTHRPLEDLREGRLRDLLRERAAATPDVTGLVDADDGEAQSYHDLDRTVDRLAAGLRSALEFDGGRLGLLLGARPAVAAAYFAAIRAGGSVVPLNRRLDAGTLASQADRADPSAFLCGSETEALAREIAPDGVPVGSLDDPTGDQVVAIEASAARSGDRSATAPADERIVVFTSGTTGDPKGVRLTAENLVASAVGSAERLGVDPTDRWFVPLPTYHVGGLAPIVRSTLYGTTVVLQREFDADETADAMAEFGSTGVSLVPTMLTRLLDAGWEPPTSLRFVLLGGAPASSDLLGRCEDRGVPVYPTYGLTETASQVATATPAEAFADPGTVGRPIDTADVTVVSTGSEPGDTRPCDPGETGELAVAGPIVTPGYLDDLLTAEAFGPYGLRTGDRGYRDGGGRLRVVGRVGDLIVSGGENVDPNRVAAAVSDLDGVADVAVVGLPDEEWGERVAALVTADGSRPTDFRSPERVRAFVRGSLADYEVPKTVAFADGLPRTPSGTVDREAVRDRLRSESDDRTE